MIKEFSNITKNYFREVSQLFKKPTYQTEKLGLQLTVEKGYWIGGFFQASNLSGGYHGVLQKWWDITELSGKVLLIGESGKEGASVKAKLREVYPKITEVYTVDLENADINWNISIEPLNSTENFDHIICQAVLEHVKDPVASVKNMARSLNQGGCMYLHSHGPDFPYHPYPIDCYRFQRDGAVALTELANLKILDMLWTKTHWFIFAQKGETNT